MKYLFTLIMGIHGLIHLMGFANAFMSTSMDKQVLGISKPIGSLWLVTFILFMVSATQYFRDKNWFYLAFAAVLISQILISLTWQDAKFGTLPNGIIALVAIAAFGNHQLHEMAKQEAEAILNQPRDNVAALITESDLKHLPEPVQRWLGNSGVVGKVAPQTVRLEQSGQLRTQPKRKWMPFKAQQYFNVTDPAFVWSTTVEAMPVISMIGRDKLRHGKGEMLIKLGGILPVVNVSDNDKVNSGAMIRFLGEICWFPAAALSPHITWEALDANSAKATLVSHDQNVSGTFTFNDRGDLSRFSAYRYYGGDNVAKQETWVVQPQSFKTFSGITIPNTCKVTWQLDEGDFHWLSLEITKLEYDPKHVF